MSLDELENLIEEQIENLKPEIKNRFIYQTTDEESGSYAETLFTQPPLIKFYLKNILKMTDNPIITSIRELLTHEIIHTIQPVFQEYKEGEAVEKFQKLNFFK